MTTVESTEAAFSVVSTGFDGQRSVWERGPVETSAAGSVTWLEWQPNRLRLLADAQSATGLVISEAFAPGWRADIDGQKAEILPTNVVAMGLPLTPGKHIVTLTYRTPMLAQGMAMSAFGLLIAGLLLMVRRRRA
jgi:uncharacterized membrane protein YfhO